MASIHSVTGSCSSGALEASGSNTLDGFDWATAGQTDKCNGIKEKLQLTVERKEKQIDNEESAIA